MEFRNINISERMEHYNVSGLSIAFIENGEVQMTKEFGVMKAGTNRSVNSNSIFNACSISKFLTAILVLKLTEQGILYLDEDINNKLIFWKVTENEYTHNKKVTLRTLLSHQSGIIDTEGSFNELNPALGNPTMVELLEGKTPYCKERIEVKYEPESDFQYSDAGFCIIQQVVEDVCGKPFEVLMDELIFEPLHMKNSTFSQTTLPVSSEQFVCVHNKKGEVVSSDIDFHLYLKEVAFERQGVLPLELYVNIHRDLSKIDIKPFRYIQCEALTDQLPEGFVGPIPSAYQIVAGRLPVEEATSEQLKESAIKALHNITAVPKYFSTLLDHGKERLTRVVRLLSTQVSPTIFHVLSVVNQDAVEVWKMPKNEAIHLLPDEEMKQFAIQFYECAERYYPDENLVDDALGMIENGAKFFESVNLWFAKEMKVSK